MEGWVGLFSAGGIDFQKNYGDVILAALFIRCLDQGLRYLPGIRKVLCDDLEDPRVALGKFDKARDFLERGLRLVPGNQFGLMELGRLSALRGDFGRAEDLLTQAIRVNPEFPFPHYFLSGIYRSQGRIPESLREMEEFQKLNPRSRKPTEGSLSAERRYW